MQIRNTEQAQYYVSATLVILLRAHSHIQNRSARDLLMFYIIYEQPVRFNLSR